MSSSPTESSQTSKPLSFRQLNLDDFEVWRPRMTRLLIFASMLLVAYWAFWLADRNMVASDHTPAYISFEQSFTLADGWLAAAALLAAIQLSRRRPSALMWLMVVGGAGMYLCAMDVLYDLQHGIYAKVHGGDTEVAINVATAALSIGVMRFGWRFRHELLRNTADR